MIYASESLLSTYVLLWGKPLAALKKAAPYWALGNLFQSVWCYVFRKQFINAMWLPMISLAFGSASLFKAHGILTNAIYPSMDLMQKLQLILLRSPISLHATWLTAASLLNLNAWAALSNTSFGFQLAVGFGSAYFAALAGE